MPERLGGLVVAVAVQQVHLPAGRGVEVQPVELEDGPAYAVQALHQGGDAGAYRFVEVLYPVVAEADPVELKLAPPED